MNLNLPILQSEQTSLPQFINFWSKLYFYPNEPLYAVIEKDVLSADDLRGLFEWKNGMTLSMTKLKSFNTKILAKIETINQLKKAGKIDLDSFFSEFGNLSFVWKIFLLHIVNPKKYPIYDQNIHRCFNFINDREHRGISNSIPEKTKQQFYLEDYLPFINTLSGIPLKKIDQAFFTFGQFLNSKNYQQFLE